MTTQLIIADTSIKTGAEGRYCLNDLHRAAGGEDKHKPAYWLRSAGDPIEEAGKGADLHPLQTKLGRKGGTFVVKGLVYAYAMSALAFGCVNQPRVPPQGDPRLRPKGQ